MPPGQAGGGLFLARHGGADQSGGVVGASGGSEAFRQTGDHCLLVTLDIGVEQHQIGRDDRWRRGGDCHGTTFVCRCYWVAGIGEIGET